MTLSLKYLFVCVSLFITISASSTETAKYRNAGLPVEERVADLLAQLTLEEKVFICHGNFTSGGIPRLGITPLLMLDGRQGLRPVDKQRGKKTTSLPSILSLSCTWDDEAAKEFGRVLAEEMLALDRHVLLAPMLNLIRSPLGGRNFENFGEDPYHIGRMGVAYIQGVQEMGIGACSCLLVANDCEHRRHFTSSNMNDRTLRELHLLPYELSVRDGKVWSMMTGNNLLNGTYCAQHRELLQGIMKDEIGFDGTMITDWRAAYDTVPTALAGTDMTTGFCHYVFGDGRLLKAVKSGDVSEELLDDKARRILRLYIRSGVLDKDSRKKGGLDTPEHRAAARKLAANGMVLLKNDKQLLPIDTSKVKRILITGPGSGNVIQGGGSGSVPAAVEITPVQAFRDALKGKVEIRQIPYKFTPARKLKVQSVEWDPETTAKNPGTTRNTDRGVPSPETLTAEASKADVVIFVAATLSASEGRDLPNMMLPDNQPEAIATIAAANPNLVVVLANNGGVNINAWEDKAPAIVAMHYSGQATGEALLDVLTGAVNPSGKLSYTFARKIEDYPVHAVGEWPAKLMLEKDPINPGVTPEERKATHAFSTEYKEGIFAGYRWFDEKNIEPWYPFGHGLSYTSFTLTSLVVVNAETQPSVSCTVKNAGSHEGAEVVQVYIAPKKSSAERPPRELKGFQRVLLKPGESREVKIALRPSAFAYYDASKKKWKSEAGEYDIEVGNSSRNLVLKSTVKLQADKQHDHY